MDTTVVLRPVSANGLAITCTKTTTSFPTYTTHPPTTSTYQTDPSTSTHPPTGALMSTTRTFRPVLKTTANEIASTGKRKTC